MSATTQRFEAATQPISSRCPHITRSTAIWSRIALAISRTELTGETRVCDQIDGAPILTNARTPPRRNGDVSPESVSVHVCGYRAFEDAWYARGADRERRRARVRGWVYRVPRSALGGSSESAWLLAVITHRPIERKSPGDSGRIRSRGRSSAESWFRQHGKAFD